MSEERKASISQRMSASGSPFTGPLYMLTSAFLFSLMGFLVKELKPRYDFFEIVFVRSLFGAGLTAFYILRSGQPFWGNNRKVLLARGIFGFLGLAGYFFALQKMESLSDAMMLLHTNPIFVALLAPLILGESATWKRYVAIVLAFTGALLIVKPSMDITSVYSLVGLGSGLMAGLAYIYVRKATRTDGSAAIMFYFPFISIVVTLPIVLSGWISSTVDGSAITPTYNDIYLLVGVGIIGTIAQLFLTIGLKLVPASKATVFNYAGPVFALAFDFFIYMKTPDALSLAGSAIIIVCALYIVAGGQIKSTGT